jgi:hypothetical protein
MSRELAEQRDAGRAEAGGWRVDMNKTQHAVATTAVQQLEDAVGVLKREGPRPSQTTPS